MPQRTPFIGGNWKMNTNRAGAEALARGVMAFEAGWGRRAEAAVFVPFPYLLTVGAALRGGGSGIVLGAQDLYHKADGAFTGEVSAAMLVDCGVGAVLVGHSERRHVIGEDEELIRLKTRAGLEAGLGVVLCVGETLAQREAGETDAVNERQVRSGLDGLSAGLVGRVTIAYEPVWAIGTGRTATPGDAQDAHAKIRGVVAGMFGEGVAGAMRIQYGGSMKPSNAAELLAQPDIDGGLIGGASLVAGDFGAIVSAAAR